MLVLKDPLRCSMETAVTDGGAHALPLSKSALCSTVCSRICRHSQAVCCVKCPSLILCLQPGTYCCQYLVDGTWMTSPDAPVGPDDDGHLCNKVRTCHASIYPAHSLQAALLAEYTKFMATGSGSHSMEQALSAKTAVIALRMISSFFQAAMKLPVCLGSKLGISRNAASGCHADHSGGAFGLPYLLCHGLGGAHAARAAA